MSDQGIFVSSLHQHVETIRQNFDAANGRFPKVHLAAEMLCNVLDQLFSNEYKAKPDKLSDLCNRMMLFGSYYSWAYAYILTTAAISDIGLISLRRAIEFTCYLAKTHKSDDRAMIWRDQSSDTAAQKKFKQSFNIPQAFLNEKYRYLWPLLICHDVISTTATHANFDMIGPKWIVSKAVDRFDMSFQDKETHIPLMTGSVLSAGYLMVDAMIIVLNESLTNSEAFGKSLESLKLMFRDARIELANYQYKGNPPSELLEMIHTDIKTGDLSENFQELKTRYKPIFYS